MENDLPVATHMRGAEEEMKNEILGMRQLPRGQFHCFAGSQEFLEMILAKGFYVSFCGNITYKSAGNLRELLLRVPRDRLLLETDSPYLPPEPLRGTVNTPANVKIIAEFVASELNLGLQELAEITSQNTKCLYSLEN
ncbi:MAG: TatD family hydrolase, TatD DNase family protein [Microgenomates group bacterium GW2011_GWC1_44_10]|nr:MAG: TatD family hydrolase, TatD DNase family protein [Microgenomates group bacterium GW2011_GWC1_44_10]